MASPLVFSGIECRAFKREIQPTSFAMAWREKYSSGACSSSLMCCFDVTQICKLPCVATVKAAPSAWHTVSNVIKICYPALATVPSGTVPRFRRGHTKGIEAQNTIGELARCIVMATDPSAVQF